MEQILAFSVLFMALIMFILGRPRYDLAALLALMVLAVAGVVPPGDVFSGFGHPAVVTVAAVLVISRGLFNSGLVDMIAGAVKVVGDRQVSQIAALTALAAVMSAFMNNVGALALLLPVAINVARRAGRPPSRYLMPLAFGSLLGGLTTLIGTPPNIIISMYRATGTGATPFGMFDFAPVGIGIAVCGVAFVSVLGWRLIPNRGGGSSEADLFDIEGYLTEVRVPETSSLVGERLSGIAPGVDTDITVVAIVRGDRRIAAPSARRMVRAGDVLLVRAGGDSIAAFVDERGLEMVGGVPFERDELGTGGVSVIEAVIAPGSPMHGGTARTLGLRTLHGVNLLAVARQGATLRARLATVRFREGDVLLLQGPSEALPGILSALGCLPLADRGLRLGGGRRALVATGLFTAAVASSVAGLLPVHVALAGAAAMMVVVGLVGPAEAYGSIDWSVIVLLAALIPVSAALEATGGAALMADGVVRLAGSLPLWATVATVLVATMFLSDLVNNAAAALLMAPVAVSVAAAMNASIDPFLMAVAIGASCAFLSPIGHQSNTLVMGPGGYRFGDYWRMGLPLEAIIVLVGVPLIMIFWPPGI